MKAFILAGGFATRLWPLTERRAKPLLPLAGKPLLTYVVESIPNHLSIIVSTNAVFARDVAEWRKTLPKRDITILIEDAGHEDQKLGALGAVARWIEDEKIQEDLVLLAGDNYAECSLQAFIDLFRGNPLIAGHDVGDADLARQFGTIVLEKSDTALTRVTSFEEKPFHPKSTVVSTGWWMLPGTTLPILTEYAKKHPDNVGGIFEEFLRRSIAVDCFVFNETWKDIGSYDAYLSLHRTIVGQRTIADPSTVIDSSTILRGSVDIGPRTTVEQSTIEDCIFFGDSKIRDCVLTRCIVDTGCTLEGVDLSDKMLRAHTTLRQP